MFTPNRRTVIQGRRSISTPRNTPSRDVSRTSLLRRSVAPRSPALNTTSTLATSTVVLNSSCHNIQSYESNLPVLISEAIAKSDDFSELSVKIYDNGCSCLVLRQKVFVWLHRRSESLKVSVCKELSLPSHLAGMFCSELVSVLLTEKGSKSMSVVAVSRKGHVIYWANCLVSISSNSETHIDLVANDEECFSLIFCKPFGYIVTTTIGALYFLEINSLGEVNCRQLHSASGMLGGISRRVSSFFFTPQTQNVNLIQAIGRRTIGKKEFGLYLLTNSSLQFWTVGFGQNNEVSNVQLVHEINIAQAFAVNISQTIWKTERTDFEFWPLDLQIATSGEQVVMLVAALDPNDPSKKLYYALCKINHFQKSSHVEVVLFEYSRTYKKNEEESLLDYDLVIEDPNAQNLHHVMMCSADRIVAKNLACDNMAKGEDNIRFNTSGDRLLGWGQSDGKYVLLSASHGLVTCTSTVQSRLPQSMEESLMNNSIADPQTPDSSMVQSMPGTPVMTQARMNQMETSDNCVQRLQAAFIHYCRHNLKQAKSLVSEAFPPDRQQSTLDNAVAVVSADLLDDYPASDPRWAESVPHGGPTDYAGSAGSLILQHQLEDKQQAHNMFLKFLSEIGVWSCLSQFMNGKDNVITRRLLLEHAEKLSAAISLIRKHPTHQGVVDASIRRVLANRGKMSMSGGLTHKDFFYREVSRIHEIFEYLVEEEEKAIVNCKLSSRERLTIVSGVNAVFETMLSSARVLRRARSIATEHVELQVEFVPWTIGFGRTSVRNLTVQQHKVTVERGVPEAEDSQQRAVLFQSLVTLTDLVLDGYKEQLLSLADNNLRWIEVDAAYQRHRQQLIEPLLKLGQLEKATNLAEKYHDFSVLVRVCDENNDQEKLHDYMNKFVTEGFSDFLFKWYLDRKEYQKLLNSCGDKTPHKKQLSVFLSAHPKLAWMHQIRTDHYLEAHDTLRRLAAVESESLATKKCMLSLGKLAAVFSEQTEVEVQEKVQDIDTEQLLIRYQESLPSLVMEKLQMAPDTMSVFSPQKLIELYVGDDNINSNEVDFKKAFEIIPFLQQGAMDSATGCDGLGDGDNEDSDSNTEAETWKLYIWCKAILKDMWRDIDPAANPFETCNHTVLFRLLKLAYTTNVLVDILPDVDSLLRRDELRELRKNTSFQYLLRASFEQVQRMQLTSMESMVA